MNTNSSSDYAFVMIGLSVMGRNLLLNMADHGFAVAGYNKTTTKLALLSEEAARIPGAVVPGFADLDAFVKSLKSPCVIMLLVTAGPAVDEVITELLPRLDQAVKKGRDTVPA